MSDLKPDEKFEARKLASGEWVVLAPMDRGDKDYRHCVYEGSEAAAMTRAVVLNDGRAEAMATDARPDGGENFEAVRLDPDGWVVLGPWELHDDM